MNPLTAQEITGVWGTLLLPLTQRGDIVWDRLADQLEVLLASGLDGVYAHGTAGEFHALQEAEFDRINTMLAKRCEAAGMPYQIGACHPATPTMLDRIRRAARLRPGAIQVILPDWLPLNDDEVVRFLLGAARTADGVPLVLYNPPHAKTPVPPRLLARAATEVPQLVGIKTAGGDDAWYTAMTRAVPHLSLFVPGHRLASGLARGAHGSYSNIAAMTPRGAAAWYRLMTTDPTHAADIEHRITTFFDHHITPLHTRGLSNPALDKLLAAIGGWTNTGLTLRWPATPAPTHAIQPARTHAHHHLPELFPP